MKTSPSLEQVIKSMQALGYKIQDSDALDYNLNLVGIRSNDMTPNQFNDWEYVFWKYAGSWELVKFRITTDPGLFYLKNPANVEGTAIVKPGQYINVWSKGLHKGEYPALVQTGPITVFRDNDKDGD